MMCQVDGCLSEAIGVIGIEIYPMPALMRYYQTDKPLSRMVVGLSICATHLPPVNELFNAQQLEVFARVCEAGCNVTVDRAGFKTVILSFDDPDYLRFKEQATDDGHP